MPYSECEKLRCIKELDKVIMCCPGLRVVVVDLDKDKELKK